MHGIKELLSEILPEERIRTEFIDRITFGADAGFYYLIPEAVVQPVDEAEIVKLFSFSHMNRLPLVFRAAGTSLSGQSVTDGILVDLSRWWDRVSVGPGGKSVKVQPGITGGMVNNHLRALGYKIGPDPASINAAMMGGILSNNSSGMCCGVTMNAYHTVRHIRFILPNGNTFSTEEEADYERFVGECGDIAAELTRIRSQILSDRALFDKIRYKYKTKNTVGYSLNAFADHQHPLDILAHLLIGAEGTLGFISEAVLDTVPVLPYTATALLYFPSAAEACRAVPRLSENGAMMVELMDRAALRSVEDQRGMPHEVKNLPGNAAALLVEFQEGNASDLRERINRFHDYSGEFTLQGKPVFARNPVEQELLWKIRKGLYPAAGAMRASGTTVILEDVAFPLDRLGDAVDDLHLLFENHSYHDAIIFGHAKDGNLHFIVSQSLDTAEEISRYDKFIKEVVDMVVVKYNGAIKAEHGTGRNMAPFVETEWGSEAYRIMKRLKKVIDPAGLLNPGVIINDDPDVHISDLKKMPVTDIESDKCVECGFCEPRCPSRDLTTTPRRRIVARRMLKQLELSGQYAKHRLLLKQYRYSGLDTCAVDGSCESACPVGINTGELVKRLRRENHSAFSNVIALFVSRRFSFVMGFIRFALRAGTLVNSLTGKKTLYRITKGIKKIFHSVPLWPVNMPAAPSLRAIRNRSGLNGKSSVMRTIVYFPSCISRMMGTYPGQEKNIFETFLSICTKSAIGVIIAEKTEDNCCGQIFSSKGYGPAHLHSAEKVTDLLWTASREASLPVVIDVSSCAYTIHRNMSFIGPDHRKKLEKMEILDTIEFIHRFVMPDAVLKEKKKKVVLHPVCALQHLKTGDLLAVVANHFAAGVEVPMHESCCGMAGDRGFLIPELTRSATRKEASEVIQKGYDGYYSTTRTCELAMSEATGKSYESILYLVDEMIE